MKVIHGQPAADWVSRQIEKTGAPMPKKGIALAFVERNEIVFGCVFSGLKRYKKGGNIWATIAKKPNKRFKKQDVFPELFSYAFDKIGVSRITCQIADDNATSQRLCENLGFHLEGSMYRAYDGERNALIYGLPKEECCYA